MVGSLETGFYWNTLYSSESLWGLALQEDKFYGWRISLGMAGVPAIIILIAGLVLHESPTSLIERNKLPEGRRVRIPLSRLHARIPAFGTSSKHLTPHGIKRSSHVLVNLSVSVSIHWLIV